MILNPYAIVIDVYAALGGKQPGATSYADHKAYINANGQAAYLTALEGMFATQTNATMSATILGNLGLASVFTAAQGEAYLAANAGNRVKAALDLASALTNYVSDATNTNDAAILAAKTTYVATTANAYTYASNAANTADAATSSAAVSTGQTFTLTTGVDVFSGTSDADTFTADETDGTVKISTADKLDGGLGADALSIYTDGTVFALGQLTSIETLNIYDLDADHTIATANFASVDTVNLSRGDGDLALTVGANVATIGLIDMLVADDMDLTLAATATAVTLNVSGLTGATGDDVIFAGAALATVNVNALTDSTFGAVDAVAATSVAINATGDLTLVDGVTTTSANATITVAGAGAVDLSALDTGVLNLNASQNSGGLTVEIGNADDTIIVGSAGNDVITASTDGAVVVADKLSVDAGAGTADVLVITNTTDINSAIEAADYTNFEIIRTAVDQNVKLVSGITGVQVATNAGITLSGVQSQAITALGNVTNDLTVTLDDATGTTDEVTLNLTSATATANVDVAGISVIGVETLNINATTGTAATDSDVTFGNVNTDTLTNIKLTGSADMTLVTTNLDAVLTINATEVTGDVTVTGALAAGSAVNFGVGKDITTVSSTLGTAYSMGAGDDSVTAALATLVADGTDDTVVNGGADSDTLTISDAAATLTDNHFTYVTNMEKFVSAGTGATSITTGAGFNTAFATGITVTTGALLATVGYTLAAGLATMDMDVTVSGDLIVGDATAESIAVTTGSGTDTVVVNAAAFIGDATTTGTAVVSTGAGDDTITVTVGTIADDANAQPITIDGGTGKDTITITKLNGNDGVTVLSGALFTIDAGDSNVTTYDVITGFDIGLAAGVSDSLDFTGNSAAGTLATSTDFGSILSHTITTGVASFDDAGVYSTALVINEANLADVVGYLAANTATLDTVAFLFDNTGDGAADSTMVFNNNTTDSLVLLVGVTGTTALSGTNASTANLMHIA